MRSTMRLCWRFALLGCLAMLVGCANTRLEATGVTEPEPAAEEYLPYGVPVPPGVELMALPQPFDPAKMGPADPDSTPELNLAASPTSEYRHMPNPMDKFDTDLVGSPESHNLSAMAVEHHNSNGYWLYKTAAKPLARAQANHDVQNNTVIPQPTSGTRGVYYYAPTLMPPGRSCIESTTIHRRKTPGGAAEHLHGFWDWCGPTADFLVVKNLQNATFRNAYVRVYAGEEFLVTYVHQDPGNGCWGAGFLNYSTGKYERQFYRCGTNRGAWDEGWTMWESYNVEQNNAGPDCVSTPPIKAAGIKVGTAFEPSDDPFKNYPNNYARLIQNEACVPPFVFRTTAPGGFPSNESWEFDTLP